ncbi:hypothetical protein AMATHDRAFT_46207 [Amanita thiersii Skay4041]|uniref:Uncharacterized protein n=1 Tax=Amanita thiersii Skay4041 TaxID=703135 RepID=A0A2A9NXL5_9AGAR|nr:hypothetical protein AMATHDRAFT_46207 [Amanita thiersii Skay4041]
MSRSRSASVDTKRLDERDNIAPVVDATLQPNSRIDDEGDKSDEHDGPDGAQPEIQQPEGYILSTVYPPQPCERCALRVLGVSIARNSNKNAPITVMLHPGADMQVSYSHQLEELCADSHPQTAAAKGTSSASASEKSRPKRKLPMAKADSARDGDGGSEDDTDELEDDQVNQTSKKRRTGKLPGPGSDRKAYLAKAVKDLEAQVSRVVAAQAAAERETRKLQERAAALTAAIQELDDE